MPETTDIIMKTNFLSASLPLLAAAAFMSSCINEVYDFRKLNLEMTVAPGVSIPVGKSLGEVSSDDLLGFIGTDTDEEGTYIQTGETAGGEVTVSADELAYGTVYSDRKIYVPVSAPDFLRQSKTGFRLHEPEIEFQVNNPVGSTVTLRGNAKANGLAAAFEIELPADAECFTVKVGGKALSDILYPIPDAILIEDLSFTARPVTKGGEMTGTGSVIYNLIARSSIKMAFEAGSEISFDTTLDLEEMGADMSAISVSLNEFDLITSVRSTFPLDLSASAVSENGTTSLSFSNEILACSTTEVKLHAKTDGALGDIRKITVSVTARNTSDGPVALSPSNTLEIDVNRLTAVSGIKYQPR